MSLSEWVVEIVVNVIMIAVAYYLGWRGHRKSVDLPYRWCCLHEGCYVSVKSNDLEGLMEVVDRHEEVHK